MMRETIIDHPNPRIVPESGPAVRRIGGPAAGIPSPSDSTFPPGQESAGDKSRKSGHGRLVWILLLFSSYMQGGGPWPI